MPKPWSSSWITCWPLDQRVPQVSGSSILSHDPHVMGYHFYADLPEAWHKHSHEAKMILSCLNDFVKETHLCRYSVVIVHNISMLRSQALLTCPGHISTICEAYRQLGPGTTLHRTWAAAWMVDQPKKNGSKKQYLFERRKSQSNSWHTQADNWFPKAR